MAGTLTITKPATDNAAGLDSSSVEIDWSFAGTAGAVQTQRQVTVTPQGSITQVINTGMQATSDTAIVLAGLASGVTYQVVVQVKDTSGALSGAARLVTPNYTAPATPTIVPTMTEYGVAVKVTNPVSGSRPTVGVNLVYRRVATSGDSWTLIGSTGNNGTVWDFTAASSTGYEYFALADGASYSTIVSIVAAQILGAWIHTYSDASTLLHFPYAVGATESLGLDEQVISFVGRTYPIVETGETETLTLAVSITLPPDVRAAGEAWWRARKRAALTLIYRDGRGRALPVSIVGPITSTPMSAGSTLTCTLQVVDLQPSLLLASAYRPPA